MLRLDFPQATARRHPAAVTVLQAHEELSRGFRYEVELLSDDARIPLKVMMARMVTISLVRAGGSLRYFNGYVTEFRFIRADGGFAFYRMVLEPFLAFARLRQDNVSFHNKTVRQITEATLAQYRQADWHMFTTTTIRCSPSPTSTTKPTTTTCTAAGKRAACCTGTNTAPTATP